MESYKVMLNGPAPWGFRLQGGKDFSMPLSISRLTPGGKAAQAGVGVGDWVLYIDGESTSSMTHIEAQNRIRACGDRLCLTLSRQPPQPLESPSIPVCDPMKLQLIEDAEGWQPRIGTPQSRSFHKLARLVGADSNQPLTLVPPFFSNTTGMPMGPAGGQGSSGHLWERCSVPKQGLCVVPAERLPSVTHRQPPEPPEPPSTHMCDPGKLRLMEDAEGWQPRTGTSQSRSFRKLAQMVGTDVKPLVSPSTPVCDPGKLRLLEDAEGWQPRTGTSQSRSFRKLAQLVGTDDRANTDYCAAVFSNATGMPAGPAVARGSSVYGRDARSHRANTDCCAAVFSNATGMPAGPAVARGSSAPRTPTATPGPASRPPWAVDPSFAERYAPDKTSTVVSKHSQPATPTPMQNRSSIVQAAQQGPEGPGRTPLCYKCNKVIRGRYLVALGHYYHPEEFTCCQCRKVLDEGGFFEEKGSIFCPKCYDTRYAPSCAKCKKKITGEVMHALKMTWHVQCFTCAACKTPIRNRAFYMEEGQPYCERDYEKMFGTKCRGCDFKIDAGDRFLEALGFSWHDTCFVCAICQTNLEGKTFYSKKDKPLCKSHAFS
ncbi:PDZ and LIM domain protein 7, partial [Cuculus canorus]